MSAEQRARLFSTQASGVVISGETTHKGMLAIGHLGRSFNRFALSRDDAAYADLDAALGILNHFGIDNELTDWERFRSRCTKKDYAQAENCLNICRKVRFCLTMIAKKSKRCAADLSKLDKGFVLFGRTRAQFVVARALFARLGGVKTLVTVLAILVGPDNAAKLARPTLLLWGIGRVLSEDMEKGQRCAATERQTGTKSYDYLEQSRQAQRVIG